MSSATVAAERYDRDDHLVGEPRPDTGRPRQQLLDRAERRRRHRGHRVGRVISGRQQDAVHALEHSSPSRLARAHLHQARQQPDGARHRTRHRQPGRHRNAHERLDHQQHDQRVTLDADPRQPGRRRSAQHDDADADRELPRPRLEDTGKVTFEVCSTNNCSSSLGTFDSTSTTLAVNANGSAAVPAGFNLASGRPTTGAPRTSTHPLPAPHSLDPVVPHRHRGADDELRDGRRRRHHGDHHLVGEPRPDAGRPRQRLLDRAERGPGHRRHRDGGHLSGGKPDALHALEHRPPSRLARAHLHQAGHQPDDPRHRTRHRQRGRHRDRSTTPRSPTTQRTSRPRRRRSSAPPTPLASTPRRRR